MYRKYGKRVLDFLFAAAGLVLLSPVMLLTALAVAIDSGLPVIFRQERIGKDGKVFRMYKFRSMKVGAEHTGSGVYSKAGDARVTRVGQFLRASSLDELPQLVNIIKGDMSFVGPRPVLTYHPWTYEKYTKEQSEMFTVRPGITGWAQVNGRKTVEWNRRIALNVWYARNVTILLDLKIFFLTIKKVLRNEDNVNTEKTNHIS